MMMCNGDQFGGNYAYLYVGLLEVQQLLPNYKQNLLFLKCFIDDGISIWIDNLNNPKAWHHFFAALNQWGTLKWTCDGHQDVLIFLDLHISINKTCKLFFQSYQKLMNLYLYIPPTSAHPAKMLHSLIYGCLRAFRLQNTDIRNFVNMATLLAKCLLPIFQMAQPTVS
jgi:hypothetical protein